MPLWIRSTMQNAHLRMATIEYESSSKSFTTRVQVHCDRLAHEKGYAHMLSVFGNDGEIAAIAAAISTGSHLTAKLPDGTRTSIHLGDKPATFRGQIAVPGRPRPLRHLLAFSETVTQNGSDGTVFVLHNRASLIWASVVSFMGLPAVPEWAVSGLEMLREKGLIREIDGFNCSPVIVKIPREELLDWIGKEVRTSNLFFPSANGPVKWPAYSAQDMLSGPPEEFMGLTAKEVGF